MGTVVYFAFFITVAFGIIEKSDIKLQALDNWSPRKLPPVRDPNRIPLSSAVAEVAAILIFNAWFINLFWPRPLIGLFGAQITLTAQWPALFWSFLALAAVNLGIASVNLFHPHWTPIRATLRLISDGVGGALFCWLVKAQVLAGIHAASLPASKAAELTNLINLWMRRSLPWAVITIMIILGFDVYRILRIRRTGLHGGTTGPVVKKLANPVVNGD